ncbi:MAG: hypothetical protein AAGA56_25055, partial [Myxococcota bacterium]
AEAGAETVLQSATFDGVGPTGPARADASAASTWRAGRSSLPLELHPSPQGSSQPSGAAPATGGRRAWGVLGGLLIFLAASLGVVFVMQAPAGTDAGKEEAAAASTGKEANSDRDKKEAEKGDRHAATRRRAEWKELDKAELDIEEGRAERARQIAQRLVNRVGEAAPAKGEPEAAILARAYYLLGRAQVALVPYPPPVFPDHAGGVVPPNFEMKFTMAFIPFGRVGMLGELGLAQCADVAHVNGRFRLIRHLRALKPPATMAPARVRMQEKARTDRLRIELTMIHNLLKSAKAKPIEKQIVACYREVRQLEQQWATLSRELGIDITDIVPPNEPSSRR